MIQCPFPWIQQHVTLTEKVSPCCSSRFNDDTNWYNENYMHGINTQMYKKIRKEMQQDIWPNICGICKDKENLGFISARQKALDEFTNIDYTNIDVPNVKYLDIKFSNTCNLACKMCKPSDSSSIEREISNRDPNELPHFLRERVKNWNQELSSKRKVNYAKYCIANGLEILKVTGGEPFACKFYLEVIDWAIDNNYANNLILNLISNGTKFNNRLMDKLVKFKEVKINISVDGTGSTYEYIRSRSNWELLNNSLDKLLEYKKQYNNIKLFISYVYQCYNAFNIPEFLDWCKSKQLLPSLLMIRPDDLEFNVKFLDDNIKNLILKELEIYDTANHERYITFINHAKIVLNSGKYSSSKHFKLIETTKLYDNLRSQDYKNYLDTRLHEYMRQENFK
jgi:MoaA/NifB/PqqE/SkfB family radical SAM enzyme